jgi:hypothetical protein
MDAKNAGKDLAQRIAEALRVSPFLNTRQAAFYLRISARVLEQKRKMGTGPLFRRHGKHIRYHIDDLDAWSRAQRSDHGRTRAS